MSCCNMAFRNEEKANWILYVAAHSPLAGKDIEKHKLYEFVKGHKPCEKVITEKLLKVAGRGWSAKYCKGILKYDYGK